MKPGEAIGLTTTVGTLLLMAGLVVYLIVAQTRGRGHGWVSWLLLVGFSRNPIYPMLVLALLPNKRRGRLREEFAAELDAKLAGAAKPAAAATVAFRAQSVGELMTNDQ